MGYVIFFILAFAIIAIFPYLFEIVITIWIISMVINLFRPKTVRRQNPFTQPNEPHEQSRPRPSGDVIDVEYTQRDADE